MLDSRAKYTLILLKIVERLGIPYRDKARPIKVVLADNSPIRYRGGVI